MGAERPPAAPLRAGRLRTYSHLSGAGRVPSEYDVVSSALLYYPRKGGFEVEVPLSAWYEKHQRQSPLRCDDWDAFRDPRETTYTTYTGLQRRQEQLLDVLYEASGKDGYDERLDDAWLDRFEATAPVLRFVGHGLQMVAAYVGSLAPAGRITMACAFQAGDEIRRIHRTAARMAQLRRARRPGLGDGSRAAWQSEPAWQPLRRGLEQLLVTYDFGEALVALNVCMKPVVDALFLSGSVERARQVGDYVWAQTLESFVEDGQWHVDWTQALLATLRGAASSNAEVIAAWTDTWGARAEAAVAAASALGNDADAAAARALVRLRAHVAAAKGDA